MTRTYESIYNDGWQRGSSLEINLQMRYFTRNYL